MSDIINQSEQMEKYFYRISTKDFQKIPANPIAYWISPVQLKLFDYPKISEFGRVGVGLQTGNNDRYIRYWFEVSSTARYVVGGNKQQSVKWYLCNKGGDYRKWYGNGLEIILWEDDGALLKANKPSAVIRNESCYFEPCVTWSRITSGALSFRFLPEGFVHNDASCFVVGNDNDINNNLLAYLNSSLIKPILQDINPTLNLLPGQVNDTPYLSSETSQIDALIRIAKNDWDSFEISWDFIISPLLHATEDHGSLIAIYKNKRNYWNDTTSHMHHIEQENNGKLIDTYELQNELDSTVTLNDITLLCNPYYRYGNDKTADELEVLLLADTMKELISYGVGCMFGRYSLDKPGLILANQGDGINEYLKEIPSPSFPIDDDNIIPVLEDDYFTDDIASRFVEFIKVAFGEEHHTENIRFIEDAIGKSIRKYFVKGFYDDHIKRYKKRPIYWMVSSPKKSFNALIYMHRYQDDIFARVQNNYLREYITKLEAAMHTATTIANDESNSVADRRKATKDIETITKKIDELIKFDRDKLTPFAQSRTPIDLDDGVKLNYSKFEEILYPIPGLKSEE